MFQGLEKEGKGIGQSGKSVGVSEKEAECLPGHVAQAGHRRPQYKPDGEHGAYPVIGMHAKADSGLSGILAYSFPQGTEKGNERGKRAACEEKVERIKKIIRWYDRIPTLQD